MTTKHKQPKPLHSTTGTDLAPNETGATGHHSSVSDQIFFIFPDNDLTSAIAQASFDTNTKTLKLRLANSSLAICGQPSSVHHSDRRLLSKTQDEGDLRQAGSYAGRLQPMEVKADIKVRCFSRPVVSEDESEQKASNTSGKIVEDVEPSLPLIRKQGSLNGPQCEEILKNLELLQDSGAFEHHERIFNFFLQRFVEKESKDMKEIVNEQEIPNGDHCNQVLKRFQLFQQNGWLKKDDQLSSLYSRLSTRKEHADMEVALIIEQGVSYWLHKQLGKSKLYFISVIKLAEHCQLRNRNILSQEPISY